MIYYPGNCCNCGQPAWVKNFNGSLATLMPGAKEIRLVTERNGKKAYLCGIALCAACDEKNVDPKVIYENITNPESTSGISNWPEYEMFGNLAIELVKKMEIK